jgi:hypothetical protein
MWTIADFKGCFEFKPKRLRVQLLPYDECDFEQIANNLDKSGFISIYTVQGQRYIKILNFEKHQNPHKNERESGSEIPDISLSYEFSNGNNNLENVENNPDKNGTTRADSLNPLTDSLLLNPDSPNLIPEVVHGDDTAPPGKQIDTELQAACRETWKSYSTAYFDRYGTEPVRNAKVNGQVKQFVQRIGFVESPHVSAFFLTHNNAYYAGRMHSVDCLLADAEKLRTEWATGNAITQTKARQMDKTQSNKDAVGEALAMLGGK